MNKLKKQRCYLAGAIDRVPDRGYGWRESITPFLEELKVEVFDPLVKPTDIAAEDESFAQIKQKLKMQEDYDGLARLMKKIRSVDLRMVDISDFLIVNLDLDTHPCGTLEEIFWANRQKKPIIIHMVQGKINAPDWLFGTIPHSMIFGSWNSLKQYLIKINNNTITDPERWCFFNHG